MRPCACPTPEQISDWMQGAADEASSAELELHLEDCPACRSQLERLESSDVLLVDLKQLPAAAAAAEVDGERLARIAMAFRATQQTETLSFPSRVRDYELLDILGEGGMGTVFRARHLPLNRLVALKVLPPDAGQRIARFQRELAHHGPLDHPHIVRALDAGESDGIHFLVTELVEGKNAAQLVAEQQRLSPAVACDIVRQAALGLAHLHERGLVHRDVKPSNLMVDASGHVRLLDFGLVTVDDGPASGERMTQDHVVLGSPDYIAPEQVADPRSADRRADLYGLGCTLFHLLTGKPPYAQYPLLKKLHAHQYEEADMTALAGLPEPIQRLLTELLAKRPEDRPATAAIVADRLTAIARSTAAPLPPRTAPPRAPAPKPTVQAPLPQPKRRFPRALLAAAVLVVAIPTALFGIAKVFNVDGNHSGTAQNRPKSDAHGDSPRAASAPPVFRLGAHTQPVTAIAYVPGSDEVVTAGAHQFEPLRVWNLRQRKQVDAWNPGAVAAMAVLPQGDQPLLLGIRYKLSAWDRTAKTESASLTCKGMVTCVAAAAERGVAAVGTDRGEVAVWDPAKATKIRELSLGDAITAVAIGSKGELVAAATASKHVSLWNAEKDEVLATIDLADNAIQLSFGADASLRIVEGYSDRHRSTTQRLLVADPSGKVLNTSVIAEQGDMCLAAALNVGTLLTGYAGGNVKHWTLHEGRRTVDWNQKVHSSPVAALAIAPDCTSAITGARDGSVVLIDLSAK